MSDPGHKPLEPAGNRPERSVSAPNFIWWLLAAVVIAVFCLLAWWMHRPG